VIQCSVQPVLRPVFACLLLAATPAAAQTACDAGETDLRFSLAVALDGTAEGATAQSFAEAANTALQGRYCVTLHPDASLFGNDDALIAALKSGEVAFAAPPVAALIPLAPSLSLIDLPFLFDSPLHVIAYLESDAAAPLLADVAKGGLHAFGILATGSRQLVGPTALIAAKDSAGLAFAVPAPGPHSADLIAALGATTADIPTDQIAAAMKSGTATGVEATWAVIDFDYLYEAPAVVTETNHGVTAVVVLGSPAVVDALSPEDRTILDDLMRNELHQQAVLAFERSQISRQVVLDDAGTIAALSPDDRAAFRTLVAPVIDTARASLGADLIDAAIAANAAVPVEQ
jgi:C4-dicarboxylate-binding protein DctP